MNYGQLGNAHSLNNASLNDVSQNMSAAVDAPQRQLAEAQMAKQKAAYAAQMATNAPPPGNVFDVATNEVSIIFELAFSASERLRQINERLFGPRPEVDAQGAGRPCNDSKIEALGEKLEMAKRQLERVLAAINVLERL